LEKRLNAGDIGFVKSAASWSGFGLPDGPGRPAQADFAGNRRFPTRRVNAGGGLVLTPGLPIPERAHPNGAQAPQYPSIAKGRPDFNWGQFIRAS
jgi:hypothetical protein